MSVFLFPYFFWSVTAAMSISKLSLWLWQSPVLSLFRKTLLRFPDSTFSSSLLQLGALFRFTTTFFSCFSIMLIPDLIVRRTIRLQSVDITVSSVRSNPNTYIARMKRTTTTNWRICRRSISRNHRDSSSFSSVPGRALCSTTWDRLP